MNIRNKEHKKIKEFIGIVALAILLCGCQNADLEETTEIPDIQTEKEADTMESSQEETEVSVAEVISEESEYLPEEETKSMQQVTGFIESVGVAFNEEEKGQYFPLEEIWRDESGTRKEAVSLAVVEEGIRKALVGYQKLAEEAGYSYVALLYVDGDQIPELLAYGKKEYKLYTYNGQIQEIGIANPDIKACTYGLQHEYEGSGLTFYCFEYVPYLGLIRVHVGENEERHDYYLVYQNGMFIENMEAASEGYRLRTYADGQPIDGKVFLDELHARGYDRLIACEYMYEDVLTAYANINREMEASQASADYADKDEYAIFALEQREGKEEPEFLKYSIDYVLYEINDGMNEGRVERVDWNNDGEDEWIIESYLGTRLYMKRVGTHKCLSLCAGIFTTDNTYVNNVNGQNLIIRYDVLYVGRKDYWVMRYDACDCLIEIFNFNAQFEGDTYSEESDFFYNDEPITMQEYEELVDTFFVRTR